LVHQAQQSPRFAALCFSRPNSHTPYQLSQKILVAIRQLSYAARADLAKIRSERTQTMDFHRAGGGGMASESLKDLRVAILVEDGFEHDELMKPRKALDEAGAHTSVVSPRPEKVRAWEMKEWGKTIPVDVPLERASPDDFDALLLPGGVMNPDKLRIQPQAVAFVRAFFDANKPVAVICHGPWTVLEAKAVRGRKMTSWPSLQTDLRNAGAHWVDEECVVDGNMVSSRKPDDIPAFNRHMIELFSQAHANA
jgi:protease I